MVTWLWVMTRNWRWVPSRASISPNRPTLASSIDDANVGRFGEMLARLGTQRQFLVITHNHVTMSHASTLYGIHLDESGSSHLVSVRLEDIRKPVARAASTAQAG